MLVTCPRCTTRLQLDDAKVPSRPFTVRCPKCQHILNAQPLNSQQPGSAVAAVSDLPTSTRAQQEMTSATPASVFEADDAESVDAHEASVVTRLLAELVRRGGEERTDTLGVQRRPSWDRRRALVCAGSMSGPDVARALAASNYEVFVAEKTLQALELLREERIEVIVLDAEFDMAAQGAMHLSREINAMRMADRRRLVFVQLSATLRTGDAHAAFLNNVNLIVNSGDAADLPRVLEKNIRDLNELYREFNRALNLVEL